MQKLCGALAIVLVAGIGWSHRETEERDLAKRYCMLHEYSEGCRAAKDDRLRGLTQAEEERALADPSCNAYDKMTLESLLEHDTLPEYDTVDFTQSPDQSKMGYDPVDFFMQHPDRSKMLLCVARADPQKYQTHLEQWASRVDGALRIAEERFHSALMKNSMRTYTLSSHSGLKRIDAMDIDMDTDSHSPVVHVRRIRKYRVSKTRMYQEKYKKLVRYLTLSNRDVSKVGRYDTRCPNFMEVHELQYYDGEGYLIRCSGGAGAKYLWNDDNWNDDKWDGEGAILNVVGTVDDGTANSPIMLAKIGRPMKSWRSQKVAFNTWRVQVVVEQRFEWVKVCDKTETQWQKDLPVGFCVSHSRPKEEELPSNFHMTEKNENRRSCTVEREIKWPLRKDDTHESRSDDCTDNLPTLFVDLNMEMDDVE